MTFSLLQIILSFGFGLVVATVVWYFVLRNNKKLVKLYLDNPDLLLEKIKNEVGDFSADVQEKIQDIIIEIRKKK